MANLTQRSGWIGWVICVCSILIHQGNAKDFEFTLWNSSDCGRPSADTMSTILQVPRDNDDPSAGITCASIEGTNFNGWEKDTHSEQTIAYISTHTIQEGCELVFYNRGPPAHQYPEEIAVGPCWQAYRRVGKASSCPSVTLDGDNIALS